MSHDDDRPMRADARANEDRLLAAATAAFARDGAGATLKQIASDAGVGIGTLYRRFPTREQLVDATYRYETLRLCARVGELLTTSPADRALRVWMSEVLDYLAAKHGMADTLRVLLHDDEQLRSRTREEFVSAIEELRSTGAAQGVIRNDVTASDILIALAGVTLAAGAADQREQAERVLDLLVDGITRQDRRPGSSASGERSAN